MSVHLVRAAFAFGALVLAAAPNAAQEREPDPPGSIRLTECLVLPPVGSGGRLAVHTDALEARLIRGEWKPPVAGEFVALPSGGTRAWTVAHVGEDGRLAEQALVGGYAAWTVDVPVAGTWLLEAQGHECVYHDGALRAGDPYQTGHVITPLALRAGATTLCFRVSRGQLRARLRPAPAPALLNCGDATLPDLVLGERTDALAAVVVVNASGEPLTDAVIRVEGGGLEAIATPVPPIVPLGMRKVAVRLAGPPPDPAPEGKVQLALTLLAGGAMRDRGTIEVRVRRPDQSRRITFLSDVDGSVQYWAWLPARPLRADGPPPALICTLHGAGVEANGQVDAYAPKAWAHLVAPTNRRPFGFDWEDWGRLDACEVLAEAARRLPHDPARVYLTGHSMGGHGAWHLACTFPDRFAAAAPSAGWISFTSYAGGKVPEGLSPCEALFVRATSPSDTLGLARNLVGLGLYVLHGEADDNVPVSEARRMREHLAPLHPAVAWHEAAGKGHWWDDSPEPGASCVDFPALMDHLARHVRPRPEAVRAVDFTTAGPGVSATCHWATIHAQTVVRDLSRIRLRQDPGRRHVTGTTENVARLALEVAQVMPSGEPVTVVLDDQTLADVPWPLDGRLWCERAGEAWRVGAVPSPDRKGPHRAGPFREAFRNRAVLVYGTQGTPEENAWALAKARYDAEVFLVRGNGAFEVMADRTFLAAPPAPDRNLVLYGHAGMHGAFAACAGRAPIQVGRGTVRIGERTITGDDCAVCFITPRPGSATACVGVVAGTGLPGLRLTDRMPWFASGVGIPDWCVVGIESLAVAGKGIRAAGYFGDDWTLAGGESRFRD